MMQQGKPTPGPWKARDERSMTGEIWIEAQHPKGCWVSHAAVRPGSEESEELGDTEANARLIAAAPDLLAFAHDCAENWDCDEDAHRYGTVCRACQAARVYRKATTGA